MDAQATFQRSMFKPGDGYLAGEYEGIQVKARMFDSGVPYLEIINNRGVMTMLPYRGCQLWHAEFDGHVLGMESLRQEPSLKPLGEDISQDFEKRSQQFLYDYGALLVHCGARRMGCPDSPKDHPLHGELPLMKFLDPARVFGEDEHGAYVNIIGGLSDDRLTIGEGYAFSVRVATRVYADEALIHTETSVHNHHKSPLEFMFLEHANHGKVDGSAIVFAPDISNLRVREKDPGHIQSLLQDEQAAYHALKAAAVADPYQFMEVDLSRKLFPELVFYGEQKAQGEAIAAQVRPDGYADVTIYDPRELPQMVIWMRDATPEQADREGFVVTNSLGLLPATGLPQGYNDAKKAGEVGEILPYSQNDHGKTVHCTVGLLNPEELEARMPNLENLLAKQLVIHKIAA